MRRKNGRFLWRRDVDKKRKGEIMEKRLGSLSAGAEQVKEERVILPR